MSEITQMRKYYGGASSLAELTAIEKAVTHDVTNYGNTVKTIFNLVRCSETLNRKEGYIVVPVHALFSYEKLEPTATFMKGCLAYLSNRGITIVFDGSETFAAGKPVTYQNMGVDNRNDKIRIFWDTTKRPDDFTAPLNDPKKVEHCEILFECWHDPNTFSSSTITAFLEYRDSVHEVCDATTLKYIWSSLEAEVYKGKQSLTVTFTSSHEIHAEMLYFATIGFKIKCKALNVVENDNRYDKYELSGW